MGDIIGDLLFYSIGRYGLNIFRKKTTIDTKQEEGFIQKLDRLIHTNLALAILIIKFTPYAPPIGLTYIGKIKVDIKKYLIYSILLCVPIPLVSTLIGFHLGAINSLFMKYSGTELFLYLSISFLIIGISISTVFFLKKKTAKVLEKEELILKKTEKNTKADDKSGESA